MVRLSACARFEPTHWFVIVSGTMSWERQQQIKSKLKEVWRF